MIIINEQNTQEKAEVRSKCVNVHNTSNIVAQYAEDGFKIPQISFKLFYVNISLQMVVLPFIIRLYDLKSIDT